MNRLSRAAVRELTSAIEEISVDPKPLIVTGNQKCFSVGADLNEIRLLRSDAFEFALMGQRLMQRLESFPSPVYAAISGYCMGGGLDLALACHFRIAHPDSVLAHRGAALGLITGWGGTQRLPRLIGASRALAMFVAARKLTASEAFEIGLLDSIAIDPVQASIKAVRMTAHARSGYEQRVWPSS